MSWLLTVVRNECFFFFFFSTVEKESVTNDKNRFGGKLHKVLVFEIFTSEISMHST